MTLPTGFVDELKTWMFDVALPFWAGPGLDRRHGGVVESFAMDGVSPSGEAFKRTRVACRQLYVFSHAQCMGWAPAAAAADHVYDFLLQHARRGPEAEWPRRLTLDNAWLDPTPDLYDYAFVLFALGWRFKATGDQGALALAHQTLDFIERHFRHPNGLGFHAALPGALPREQNPHMHLTESALVLAEASGDQRFFDLAASLIDLLKTRLIGMPEGILPEFFDEDWRPIAGEKGRWTEPGHQFEWSWILSQHQKLCGANHAEVVAAMVDRGEQFGVDPATQATFNRVRDDGFVLDAGSRTWPNTERMKGWIALFELTGRDPSQALAGSGRLLLDRYLFPAPPGRWIDSYDAAGAPTAATIPTSTLYHVFLAFAETIRIAPALTTKGG